MGSQRKRIGLWCGSPTRRVTLGVPCLLLLVSGGWIAFASHPSAEGGARETGREGSETRSLNAQPPTPAHSSFLSDPNLPAAPGISLGNGELFLRMMLSVGLVIGLGAAALYLSKRALPRAVHAGGKEIHILETAYLGPRKAIHLVEVGSQRLLLASTSDSIALLAPVTEAWRGVPNAEFCVGEPMPELGEAKV
jgi:hypothetical protein